MVRLLALLTFCFFFVQMTFAQTHTLSVDWNKIISVSKITSTLQIVDNPMVHPSSPVHRKNSLISPKDKEIKQHLPDEAKDSYMKYAGTNTEESEAPSATINNDADITLKPFAVAAVQLN